MKPSSGTPDLGFAAEVFFLSMKKKKKKKGLTSHRGGAGIRAH